MEVQMSTEPSYHSVCWGFSGIKWKYSGYLSSSGAMPHAGISNRLA